MSRPLSSLNDQLQLVLVKLEKNSKIVPTRFDSMQSSLPFNPEFLIKKLDRSLHLH